MSNNIKTVTSSTSTPVPIPFDDKHSRDKSSNQSEISPAANLLKAGLEGLDSSVSTSIIPKEAVKFIESSDLLEESTARRASEFSQSVINATVEPSPLVPQEMIDLLTQAMERNLPEELEKLLTSLPPEKNLPQPLLTKLLIFSATTGYVQSARILIEKGANVHSGNMKGVPLALAAIQGNEEMVKLLLEKGADVNACNYEGHTPLMFAAMYGHEKIIKILIDTVIRAGGDPLETLEKPDNEGNTALSLAAEKGQKNSIEVIIQAFANANDDNRLNDYINRQNNEGYTPFMAAVIQENEENILAFIHAFNNSGIQINEINKIKNDQGQTPFMLVAGYGHEKALQLLIKGVDPALLDKLLNDRDKNGKTAFALAAKRGEKTFLTFIQALAAEYGYKAILKLLINSDRALLVPLLNVLDKNGETLLTLAATNGHKDSIEALIQVLDDAGVIDTKLIARLNVRDPFEDSLMLAAITAKSNGAPKEEITLIIERARKRYLQNPAQAEEIQKSALVSINGLGKMAKQASQYGNKTANLQRLSEIFKNTSTIVIPQFQGISHDTVVKCIQLHFPGFNELWKEFTEYVARGQSIESLSHILAQIQHGIKRAISASRTFPADSDIQAFLNQQKPIMVRSTGREDTLKVANPGGNESIPNVQPNRKDISNAIGEVIASYFSEKSLGQRLAAGDDLLQPPFMPVLLQVMVGESEGNIPTSGVMYTTEGDLGTDGVVQISASFGHADGIVTGSMPSDIYYKQGNHIHAIVSDKPNRRAPGATGTLTTVKNPSNLKTKSCLTKKEIDRITRIGKHLEQVYGFPLDIEWTLDRATGTLYVLQARPISHESESQIEKPSYVNPEKIKKLKNIQQVSVVVAKGQAPILRQDNVLMCQSAKEAVQIYLAANPKPKAILIATPSAPNSHEAGFFKDRIPLIYLPGNQYKAALNELKNNKTLILDTQESFIATVPDTQNPSELLSEGLRRHLAPKMESVVFETSLQSFNKFLNDLNREAGKFNDKDLKLASGWNILDKLLNSFEEARSPSERAYFLASVLRIIEERLLQKIPEYERDTVWQKILSNARQVWDISNTDADILNQKFAMNWLRAAILQSPAPNVVDSETLYTALGAVKERTLLDIEKTMTKRGEAAERDAYLDIFQRSQKFILLPEVRSSWNLFVQHLDLRQMKQLDNLFKTLGPQIIEIWINSSFAEAWSKDTDNANNINVNVKNCLDNLLKRIQASNIQESIDMQRQALDLARQFSDLASTFAEPSQFDGVYANLEINLVPMMYKCIDMMEESSEELEMTILTYAFNAMVTAFDACIKGLSESPLYDKTQESVLQAQRFAKMLKPYYLSLNKLMKINLEPGLRDQADILIRFLPKRYEELCQKINDKNSTALLLPSERFSVAMAALGSNYGAPYRAKPETLVDFFTMVHQSLIVASQSINTFGGTKIVLPEQLQQLSGRLCGILNLEGNRKPSLQNIVYHYPNITLSFNAPLGLHSAQFLIHAEVNSKGDIVSAEFEGRFFPSDTVGVGDQVKLIALMSYYSQDYQMTKPDNYDYTTLLTKNTVDQTTPMYFKWTIPLDQENFIRYQSNSIRCLQDMIDDFSLRLDVVERIEGKFNRFFANAANLQLFKDHPWSFCLISKPHKIDKEQQANIVNAALEGLLQHRTSDNLSAFLISFQKGLFNGLVDLPPAPIFLQLIDRLIDDDAIWQDANKQDVNNLYSVLVFLTAINHVLLQDEDNYEVLKSKLINLNIFTSERLKKLYQRAHSMPKEIQSKNVQHQRMYQEVYQKFTELYGIQPT